MTAEATRFLSSFAQALSTMALYSEGHPAREGVVETAFSNLQALQLADPLASFSFLGDEVLLGHRPIRELRGWDWSGRLSSAGIQRMEFAEEVTREDFESFLSEVLARLTLSAIQRVPGPAQGVHGTIRFGSVGIRELEPEPEIATATIALTLREEAQTVGWLHEEMMGGRELPLAEAEAVVRSLSVAMHGDQAMVMPLLRLRRYDEYTTTHSLNVCVLAMALSEWVGLGARDVRSFGVSGLLHDIGKIRIPTDILNKAGRLTPEEREVMNQHPVEGARIIVDAEENLDLAAVVAYEHHIMLNGGGYPKFDYARDCHQASKMVHVCDVYDALRTNRPYRAAWPAPKVLQYIEERAGTEFDPETSRSFIKMMGEWEPRLATVDTVDDAVVPAGAAAPAAEPAGAAAGGAKAPSAPAQG
jgi:putative nucleotidyltransferase with HDIG domain